MTFNKKKLAILISGCFITANSLLANESTDVDLDSLIISAKAPVDQNNYSGSVSVITAEEIQASGATDLTDILNLSVSVQLSKTGRNPTLAPRIRGFDSEQVLILVNGKRIPNTDRSVPSEPAYRYGLVPIANIEKIEIIRGPASSLYGADALAGVINIITKKSTSDWSGSISVYGEVMDNANGGDGQGVSVSASGAITDSVDLLVSGGSSRTDEILDDDNLASQQSSKDIDNYQVELGVDMENGDRLELGVINSDEQSIELDSSGVDADTTDIENQIFTAEYFTQVSGFETSLSLVSGEASVLEGTKDWTVNEDNISIDAQGYVIDKHYLSFALSYREEEAIRDDTTSFQDKVDSTALMVQDVFQVTDKSNLTLGLAFDEHSKYGSEISPKISVFNQLTPSIGLKAGYGKSYLAPSISQGSSEYVVGAGPTRQYSGNDDLKPETAKTAEVGITFKQKNNSGSVTLFHSDVKDLISTVDTTSGGFTSVVYENVDSATLQGIELNWSVFNDNQTKKLSLSYTYLDAKDESTGKELTDRADQLVKANYQHKSFFSDLDLDAQLRYVGDQYTDADNTNLIDGYLVADFGVSKQVLDNTTLRFGINNIADEVVLDETDQFIESGRSYKLSLTSTF